MSKPNAQQRPTKEGAVSTISNVATLALEVAKAVSEVPYVGAVANLIQRLIQIREELETQKDRCCELLDRVDRKSKRLLTYLLELKEHNERGKLEKLSDYMCEYKEFLEGVEDTITQLQERSLLKRILNRDTKELEKWNRKLDDFHDDMISAMVMEVIKGSVGKEQPVTIGSSDIANGMMVPSVRDCVLERDSQQDLIVQRLLATPDTRVALLGMGGIGKTTLACRIARDPTVVDAYSRRLFISFEGASTPELAYTSLATIFQIPADRRTSKPEILSQIVGYLSQTKTLLILDNFETFWEASENRRSANEFLEKLASLSNLAIIVTLRGIQRPETISWLKIDPLETLSESASKELFASIAQADYDHEETEHVQNLLKGVAGVPLAVAIIGNLLRDGSERPHSLWRRWNREKTQVIGSDVADRQYQLDVSLKLSIYGPRMNDHARDLLAVVSLLPSGLNMDDEWLDDLAGGLPSAISLGDCIRTVKNVALSMFDSLGPHSRLRLLQPVRDFCLGNLNVDSELVRRLIDIYRTHLVRHKDYDKEENYAWVARELSNLTAIIRHALDIHHTTDDLGYLCEGYSRWRIFLGMPATDILESVIEVLENDSGSKANCLQALGSTLIHVDRFQEAVQHLEQALPIHRNLGQRYEMAWDLSHLGDAHYHLDDYPSAERYLNEAKSLFTESGDNSERADTLERLAEVYRYQDKFSEAESVAAEALELFRMASHRLGEANAQSRLGDIYRGQGKFDKALEALKAACDISRDIKARLGEAYSTRSVGYLYLARGEVDQAASHFRAAISLFEQAQLLREANALRHQLEAL